MPSTLRGADINAWFRNRATRRKETTDLLAKLHDAESKLNQASGNADPTGAAPIPGESVDDLLKRTAATLAELTRIEEEISELNQSGPAIQSTLFEETCTVHRASEERARRQQELAKQQAQEARWASERRKQKLKKFGIPAAAIILLILMVKC